MRLLVWRKQWGVTSMVIMMSILQVGSLFCLLGLRVLMKQAAKLLYWGGPRGKEPRAASSQQ